MGLTRSLLQKINLLGSNGGGGGSVKTIYTDNDTIDDLTRTVTLNTNDATSYLSFKRGGGGEIYRINGLGQMAIGTSTFESGYTISKGSTGSTVSEIMFVALGAANVYEMRDSSNVSRFTYSTNLTGDEGIWSFKSSTGAYRVEIGSVVNSHALKVRSTGTASTIFEALNTTSGSGFGVNDNSGNTQVVHYNGGGIKFNHICGSYLRLEDFFGLNTIPSYVYHHKSLASSTAVTWQQENASATALNRILDNGRNIINFPSTEIADADLINSSFNASFDGNSHLKIRGKTNAGVAFPAVIDTRYWKYTYNGVVNNQILLQFVSDWTSSSGKYFGSNETLSLIGVTVTTGSGSASAAGDLKIQLRRANKDNVSQQVAGGGTLVKEVTAFSTGAASGSLYARSMSTTFSDVAITQDQVYYCEVSAAGFWSFTDFCVEWLFRVS